MLSEIYWRQQYFKPNISDSKMNWALERNKINKNDNKRKIVIIGASRAQSGIVPKILEENFTNTKVINLTIDGIHSLYILKDLSEEPNFKGLILFSLTAATLHPHNFENALPWVEFYHNKFISFSGISEKLNLIIQIKLQEKFVIMSSKLRLIELINSNFKPRKLYGHMDSDRYRALNYYERLTYSELVIERKRRIEYLNENKLNNFEKRILRDVINNKLLKYFYNLKKNGSNLVLIRMPSTNESWEYEEKKFPREIYWNNIVTLTNIPSIHFKDFETLKKFECPDTSHLDSSSNPEFTKNLGEIINNKINF
jgi:hypothetical protein